MGALFAILFIIFSIAAATEEGMSQIGFAVVSFIMLACCVCFA